MGEPLTRALRGALAGATAASVWAAQQPLDKRVFRCGYDDTELLGKAVTRGPGWLPVGLALHAGNGAVFGAVYAAGVKAVPGAAGVPPVARGALAGLSEHVGLWPLGRLVDRFHPARRELTPLTGNRRAFWQAAWRHGLFGVLLGALEAQLNGAPDETAAAPAPAAPGTPSSNGHGSLEGAATGRAGS